MTLCSKCTSALTFKTCVKEIAGPKCVAIKVKHPDKCHFKPKELLAVVIEIFMNLAKHEDFATAVIRDERSYDQGVLAKAEQAKCFLKKNVKSQLCSDSNLIE